MSHQEYYHKDEITLKELFLKIGDFANEILKHWKLVLLVSSIFAGLYFARAFFAEKQFPAKLTFVLDEQEGGGGGASSLLGEFGIAGGGNGVNVNRMIDMAKSRKIVSEVLFKKVDINGNVDFIANHIIKAFHFHDKWSDSNKLNGFLFQDSQLDSFDVTENMALKSLHLKFTKEEDGIMSLSEDELSGILTLAIKTPSQKLSLNTVLIFYENLKTYYVEKAIKKQQDSYDLLKSRTDSIQLAMDSKQLSLLRFEDRNRGLGLREYENRRYRIEAELKTLALTFAETYKRFQLAEYNLQNKKPFISAIDKPIYPIYPAPNSKLTAVIIGALVGLFLIIVFIIGRKFYRDVME